MPEVVRERVAGSMQRRPEDGRSRPGDAANGAGSLVAALALPRLLDRFSDRVIVSRAAVSLVVVLFAGAAFAWQWPLLPALWVLIGAACSLALTPGARLLRRSACSADRPALFAADFALSHACWLVCYPLAGWVATVAGMTTAFVVLGAQSNPGRFWETRHLFNWLQEKASTLFAKEELPEQSR